MSNDALYASIDNIIAHVERHKVEPLFSAEKQRRENLVVTPFASNSEALEALAVVIAYSQQAKSELVRPLVESDTFRQIFLGFDIPQLLEANPCVLARKHWPELTAIRKKGKVFQICMAAYALNDMEPLAQVLETSGVPQRIHTSADIELFWKHFKKLLKVLLSYDIPFLSSTTSLLHFLLHIGYDCIKPDSVVMKGAKNLNIVDDVKKDANLCKVARTLQEYALSRGMRPGVIDLYFLINERQTDALQYVGPGFKPARF